MKIRILLLASVLSVLFLSGGRSTATPATTCPNEICVDSYNYCAAQCGTNQACLRNCRNEYAECQCYNACGCPADSPEDPWSPPQTNLHVAE
jgi:hypothetical protein